jgi:hypothetical protein
MRDARFHLLCRYHTGVKRVDACCTERRRNCLRIEHLDVDPPEHTGEVTLPHWSPILFFKSVDLVLPGCLHLCEASNVEALQSVSAVWRISKQDDIVGPSKLHDVDGIMGAMAVEQQNSWFVCGPFLFGLWIEDFCDPFQRMRPICPAIRGVGDSVYKLAAALKLCVARTSLAPCCLAPILP